MATIDERHLQEIDEFLAEWVFRESVPGAGVVLFDADGELYADGFGARDLDTNAPATPDTLFGTASITKSVTALAVLQLAEAGALSLDDPVDAYVDDLAALPGDPVTIEELLTHTSGIPSTGVGAIMQLLEGFPGGVADATDRRRLFRAKADLRVTDEDRFLYNNAGYGVLGDVIEAVDGRAFETYVREEILDPLGMERSGFGDAALTDDENAATPYLQGDPPEEAPSHYDALNHPNDGLVASPRELGRYLRAMMTDGSVDGGRVCEPDTVERLQRGRVAAWTRLDGTDEWYGYGWDRVPFDGDEQVGVEGGNPVTSAYGGFLVEAGLGVVLACNTHSPTSPRPLGMAVLAMATGRDRTVVPDYALAAKTEAVAGTYTDYRERVTVTVEPEDGGLELTQRSVYSDGEDVVRLLPESLDPEDHRFYTVDGAGVRVTVEFDVGGDRADMFYGRARFRREEPGT